jgi:chemotaxis methyl-accepting protein methylase
MRKTDGPKASVSELVWVARRNVMIYFSLPSQQLLVDLLYRSLLPGGYLFTGDAEPRSMNLPQYGM